MDGFKPIKTLLIIKGLLIALVGLWHFNIIKIGEKDLSAETASEPNPSSIGELTPEESSKKVAENSDEKTANPRKSFLDDLLQLPTLNPDNVKKEEVARYLALAEMKQEQVENRLNLLKEKEIKLIKLEKLLDDKIRKIQEERDFFAQTVQKEKTVQKERIDHLVNLYKKMEPKKAAPVFENIHKDLAVALFKQIDQKQITKILEAMNPTKAVEISEYYSRIRSAREYDALKDINQSLISEFQECKGLPPTSAH